MAIIKTETTTQLEMGFGDIRVSPGLLKDTEKPVGVVCFFNQEPHEIGEHQDHPEKVVNMEDTPVRMVFDKVESIDVVIWALEKSKEYMQKGVVKEHE